MAAFKAAYDAMRLRPIRVTSLEVIDNPLDSEKPPAILAPGTMTIFFGRKGSGAIPKFKGAVRQGGAVAQDALDEIFRSYRKHRKLSTKEMVKSLVREPVFADLRYAGITLNQGLFVPKGVDICLSVMPYNGGRLAPEGFTLAEHGKDGSEAELEAFVVRTTAPLTKAEQAALSRQTVSQAALNVGVALDCETTWVAVGVVVGTLVAAAGVAAGAAATIEIAAAVAAVTAGLMKKQMNVHMSEAAIAKLGPDASARQLVQLRANALQATIDAVR